MMKILIIVLFLIIENVLAREYQLGVVLGAPTGVSAKMSLDQNHSLDAALAYALVDDLGLEFHMDYLIENVKRFSILKLNPISLYYGIGGRGVAIDKGQHNDSWAVGPRTPIGLSITVNNPTLFIFSELALAFDLTPRTNLDLEAGLGLRYRF